MAKVVRRKRKKFRCGVCGHTAEKINPSKYCFKEGSGRKSLCTRCSSAMIHSAFDHYEIRGNEIRFKECGAAVIPGSLRNNLCRI